MDLTALIVRRLCPVIVCLLVLNYSSFCELWSFIRSILCISWFIVICFPHQKNPKNIKRAKMWKLVFFIFNVVSQCSEWGDRKTLLLHLRCRDSHVTPAKVEVRNASHGCVTGSANENRSSSPTQTWWWCHLSLKARAEVRCADVINMTILSGFQAAAEGDSMFSVTPAAIVWIWLINNK